MAIKSLAFFFVFALFVSSIAIGDKRLIALDTKDPDVIQVAKFALEQHNKDMNAKLSFGNVFQAAGTKDSGPVRTYALVVMANDAAKSSYFDAVVSVSKGGQELVGFKENVMRHDTS